MSISKQSVPHGAKKGILKTPAQACPSATNTSAPTSNSGNDDEGSSQATTVVETEIIRSNAWTSGKTSKTLFPTARSHGQNQVNPGDWSGYLVATSNEEVVEEPSMFNTQFWNPTSKGYSVDRFWSDVVNGYICPFPGCSHGAPAYAAGSDLEYHIKLAHMLKCFRCPLCLKRFDKVAKLVGHMENSMKCRVKESEKFGSVRYIPLRPPYMSRFADVLTCL
jgi:hypothetical protein